MSIKHKCQVDFSRSISIAIAGAGGTGCALAASLGRMAKTLRSILPAYRMQISIYDPAPVRDANLCRQPYGAYDIGLNKASALDNAMSLAFPVECEAHPNEFVRENGHQIVAVCVDSAAARRAIMGEILERGYHDISYLVDCGNMRDFGQCLVGLAPTRIKAEDGEATLPPPWDVAPDLYDPAKDDPGEPSCSSAEAIASQDFNVNHFAAMIASEHIWKLITKGELETRGAFFNLRTMACAPLKLDAYRQIGETFLGRGQSNERYKLSRLQCGTLDYLKRETLCRDGSYNELYRLVEGELIDPLTMKPYERVKNALWRNIETVLNNDERIAA